MRKQNARCVDRPKVHENKPAEEKKRYYRLYDVTMLNRY